MVHPWEHPLAGLDDDVDGAALELREPEAEPARVELLPRDPGLERDRLLADRGRAGRRARSRASRRSVPRPRALRGRGGSGRAARGGDDGRAAGRQALGCVPSAEGEIGGLRQGLDPVARGRRDGRAEASTPGGSLSKRARARSGASSRRRAPRRVVARQAGAAELRGRQQRRLLQPLEREVGERGGADVLAHLLDRADVAISSSGSARSIP